MSATRRETRAQIPAKRQGVMAKVWLFILATWRLGAVVFGLALCVSAVAWKVSQLQFFIPIDTAIDPEEERKKLTEELKYAKGFLQSVEKKLSNDRFVSNAPEQVIAMERKKAADAQEKITLLEKSLNQL